MTSVTIMITRLHRSHIVGAGMRRDGIEVVMYPIVWRWIYIAVVYFFLMSAPAFIPVLIAETFIVNSELIIITANIILLPILYSGLYLFLRKIRTKFANFIFLVAAFFVFMGSAHSVRAMETGAWMEWLGAIMSFVYAAGFCWVAWLGRKMTQAEDAAEYNAEREEQIAIQTEAILRAQQIQQQGGYRN